MTLSAAYLAETKPGDGAGFLLTIQNNSSRAIAVPWPVPLSVHWYAAAPGGKWLWRASSGDGGNLVNALAPRGRVFAMPAASAPAELRQIAPHQTLQWEARSGQDRALRYRPGCEHCSYAGETQFRAVLAYAYLPQPGAASASLLQCGLRSAPVVMPPLANGAAAQHNSGGPRVFQQP